jgi:hypothetical protein
MRAREAPFLRNGWGTSPTFFVAAFCNFVFLAYASVVYASLEKNGGETFKSPLSSLPALKKGEN